ncbi:hypothetical protein GCM10023328_20940 [Modestobacter marinus]|uniref:Uncharacterized protein n=1 Tax=Modestobacter marinus TaxID=477641 RepID=A0A846LT97_9ACTN|nr:hypothetical protein [Modestobacter marinus]NIH65680.1 hypothetical protein [Modestobacter marinus]GGL66242.1 hypothetical protein GCM10011589_23150 [Modestobacter marinus]
MTVSLSTIGTDLSATHVASTAHDPRSSDRVTHAVARPVVDGLDQSVCGVLVSAVADQDWLAFPGADRCPECTRIAG